MAKAVVSLLLSLALVEASNPFSSNVVALTPKNFKQVLDSPHAWFVNVCRATWGYCSRLTPEWEKLAGKMKNSVKIAYWDTEQQARMPSIIGEIKGTPTIKFITPNNKKNKRGKFNKKIVRDYNGERKYKDMMTHAENSMPSFTERINGQKDLDKFNKKAAEYGLPRVLMFSKATSHIIKHMSTEFRRRVLIAEVRGTSNNKNIVKEYGITDFPKVIALSESGEVIELKKKPTFNRMKLFLQDHTLAEPVFGTLASRTAKPEKGDEDELPEQEKEEL